MEQNKTGRYMKYALGEIILVVIGILIALSINNWNEERKNNQKESFLVKNIVEDLKLDSVHINQSLNELTDQLAVVDNFIAKALDSDKSLINHSLGLVRYSSDFRPISQKNHAESVSNLENIATRKLLQNYFLLEDQVMDIFIEYEDIIHNKIRPYLSDVGMHKLTAVIQDQLNPTAPVLINQVILEEQLEQVKFQQLLFERRLKTDSFQILLNQLKLENKELIEILNLSYK
jgi:hypothetical protein